MRCWLVLALTIMLLIITACTIPVTPVVLPTVTSTPIVPTVSPTFTQIPTFTPTPSQTPQPTCPPLRPDLYGSLVLHTVIGDTPGALPVLTATVLFSYTQPLPMDGVIPQRFMLTTGANGTAVNGQVFPGVYTFGVMDYVDTKCYAPFYDGETEIAVSAGEQAILTIEFAYKPVCKPTVTPTVTPTATKTPTPIYHQCPNYWTACVDVALPCPSGTMLDPIGLCGAGFRCCVPTDGTPTKTPTVTPTPTRGTPVAGYVAPGAYLQYDWPCMYPLVTYTAPNGVKMPLCWNGLDGYGNFKNNNAFREDGGMNWPKLASVYPTQSFVDMAGVFWISWADINPSDGVYNWAEIDRIVAGAKLISMDTPSGGTAPKGVMIRLYNAISTRPSQQYVAGIDGGFIFDDLTPQFVKSRIRGSVSWGGPVKLADGSRVSGDDGSYWVKMPCVYEDYKGSHAQGSNWDYSIWVLPKYDRSEWKFFARKMLADVAKHYEGSGIAFTLGLAGVDGEYGNWLQNSFAGCGNLRRAAEEQYGINANDMHFTDMATVWRANAPTLETYVSCSSDCDPNWFIGQNVGMFQARATEDSAIYHRPGDVGVMDWAIKWANMGLPVAWENAYPWADDAYMYRMLSLMMGSWPEWFSFVGGSWANAKVINMFLPELGQTITTTKYIYIKSYWTCFDWPDVIHCPGGGDDMASSQYMGWMRNIERGISTDWLGTPVMVAELSTAQAADMRAKMLRRLNGSMGLFVDQKWPGLQADNMQFTVTYLDAAAGAMKLTCTADNGYPLSYTWEAFGNGQYTERSFYLPCDLGKPVDAAGHALTVEAAGVMLHEVRISQ
jgi:hypothetical protein